MSRHSKDHYIIELISAALILIGIMVGLYVSKSIEDKVQRQIDEDIDIKYTLSRCAQR